MIMPSLVRELKDAFLLLNLKKLGFIFFGTESYNSH